jgi:hypothetical protein
MRKLIIGTALALLSLIAVENHAHAYGGSGYVCMTMFFPPTPGYSGAELHRKLPRATVSVQHRSD